MGLFGPPNIARLEAGRKISGLIKALHYRRDSYVQANAAAALGRLSAFEAVDPLVDLCRMNDDHVGPAAVEALARIGEAAADATLRSKVIQALIETLQASDTGRPGLPRTSEDDFEASRSRARYESSRLISARLWDDGLYRRSLAAAALGRLRDRRAVDPLLTCLRRHHGVVRDFHTRRAAADSLRLIGDARAIPGLEAALGDEDEEVRCSVRMALSALVASPDRT